MKQVKIFDTTLRDGEQSPGCSMNLREKLEVAQCLEKLKVDVIEAGFAIASPGDFESVQSVAKLIKDCSVASLSRATKKDIDTAWEAVKCAADPRIHTFLATSPLHMEYVDEYNVDVQMHTVTYHLSRMTAGGEAPAKAEQPKVETATPVPEEPTAAPVTETRSGEPWGDSDGVISHEKLAGLYRWLKETSSDFWKTLTFDDVGEAVGKQGFDKKNGDGKYHAAYWTDGGKYYVNITFYNRDGVWTVGSITTGMNSSEYSSADISSFPVLGNRRAGSSPVKRVELDAKIGFSSGPKVGVSTDLPTENWFATVSSSSVRFSNAPTEKAVNGNTPGIRVECKESLEKIDSNKEKFENLKELAPRTIGGIQMQGRSYKYVGMEWIEYYGQIQDGVWASVTITGVDPYPGSEAEAILNTMAFAVK